MPAITTIKLRRDTAADWATTNPILADGEQGYETDTGLIKVGNGTSAWDALNYQSTARLVQPVKNASGASIAKGSVVYISGATGDNALISLADADSESTSSKTLGLVSATVANDGFVDVVSEGIISGINTASATAGQSVWLSSTAGQFVFNAPPAKPAHSVYLGVVLRAHATEGEILVKVQNGYELNELHDVNAGSPSDNNVLAYDSSSSMWTNQTASQAGLETPAGAQSKADAAKTGAETTAANALSAHESDTTSVHGIADTSLLATKSYADNAAATAAAAVVDSAPGTLDTLNELAAALGDDANFATTISTSLGNKQDKVTGVSDTEIGYLDGVTSAIQTQLNGKAASTHTHTVSEITDYTPVDISGKQDKVTGVSDTEIGYLDGVTSSIQTQLGNKQDKVTGVSDTEIGYLANVTSDIQAQIDAAGGGGSLDASTTYEATEFGINASANSDYGIAIGPDSSSTDGGMAIGSTSAAQGGIAIGTQANNSSSQSIAIGNNSSASDSSIVIGHDNTIAGYGDSIYIGRDLTAITGGLSSSFEAVILGNYNINRFMIPGMNLDTNAATDGYVLGWTSTGGNNGGPGFTWINPATFGGGGVPIPLAYMSSNGIIYPYSDAGIINLNTNTAGELDSVTTGSVLTFTGTTYGPYNVDGIPFTVSYVSSSGGGTSYTFEGTWAGTEWYDWLNSYGYSLGASVTIT